METNQYCKGYTKKKEEKEREKERIISKHRLEKRRFILKAYGNKCACCGEEREEFLAIDHINNDGNIFRKNFKGDFYTWIIKHKFPSNLQLLCHNCNTSKGRYGYCPHQKEKGQKFLEEEEKRILQEGRERGQTMLLEIAQSKRRKKKNETC